MKYIIVYLHIQIITLVYNTKLFRCFEKNWYSKLLGKGTSFSLMISILLNDDTLQCVTLFNSFWIVAFENLEVSASLKKGKNLQNRKETYINCTAKLCIFIKRGTATAASFICIVGLPIATSDLLSLEKKVSRFLPRDY